MAQSLSVCLIVTNSKTNVKLFLNTSNLHIYIYIYVIIFNLIYGEDMSTFVFLSNNISGSEVTY